MIWKKFSCCLVLVLSFFLASCGEDESVSKQSDSRPVKTLLVPELESKNVRSFPARVESTRRAEVSFRVSGKVVELPIKEGERIEQGAVIAKLDPTDFQLAVDDREAEYSRTLKDFERAEPLAEKGIVTRRERDRREAEMKRAHANLRKVKQDLKYSTLLAPFSGEVSKRLIQNFEEVQAKQTIIELRDITALEVKFDVPEQIMIRVTEAADEVGETQPEPDAFAYFDAAPKKKFKLKYRELATKADPATRTFEATYVLQTPKDLLVLPGMTANVTIDLKKYLPSQEVIYVPVEAVVASGDLTAKVWVVDEKTMTVSSRKASVGELRGNKISVVEGLKPGDRLVVAGVPFLVEGMKVNLLPTPEQADEREDDVKIRRKSESRQTNKEKAQTEK